MRRATLALAVSILTLGTLLVLDRSPQADPELSKVVPSSGSLTFLTDRLELDPVPEGERVIGRFPFVVRGTGTSIEDLRKSCNCLDGRLLVDEGGSLVESDLRRWLEAGTRGELEVVVATEGLTGPHGNRVSVVESGAPETPTSLWLSYHVEPWFEIDPPGGLDLVVSNSKASAAQVRLSPHAGDRCLWELSSSPEWVEARLSAEGGDGLLHLSPSVELDPGLHRGKIQGLAHAASGEAPRRFCLEFSMRVLPDLDCRPRHLVLGLTEPGTFHEAATVIQVPVGARDLSLELEIGSDLVGVVDPSLIARGDSYQVDVRVCEDASLGIHRGTILLRSNHPTVRTVELPVSTIIRSRPARGEGGPDEARATRRP